MGQRHANKCAPQNGRMRPECLSGRRVYGLALGSGALALKWANELGAACVVECGCRQAYRLRVTALLAGASGRNMFGDMFRVLKNCVFAIVHIATIHIMCNICSTRGGLNNLQVNASLQRRN